jgi:hypothetical protein|tara:strand:- start:311 stop:523 length:213 start_codon:yes stop_codon:yes gene_type:complete
MKTEKQTVIISSFLGFTIGVLTMMFINKPQGELCYKIIEDIEYQVCEECWYDVFDGGEKYQEVQDYVTWE